MNIWISPVICNICLHLCPLGPGTGEAELCALNTWLQNTLRNSEAIQSHRRAVFIMCTVLDVCMYGCVHVCMWVGMHMCTHGWRPEFKEWCFNCFTPAFWDSVSLNQESVEPARLAGVNLSLTLVSEVHLPLPQPYTLQSLGYRCVLLCLPFTGCWGLSVYSAVTELFPQPHKGVLKSCHLFSTVGKASPVCNLECFSY